MTISYDFGLLKSIGDAAGFVARRIEGGLEQFKEYLNAVDRKSARGASTTWKGNRESKSARSDPGQKPSSLLVIP
jgi:hypothetical protein